MTKQEERTSVIKHHRHYLFDLIYSVIFLINIVTEESMFLGRAALAAVSKSLHNVRVTNHGRLGLIGQQQQQPHFVRGYSVSAKFEEAQARLKTLREEPENDVKLKIYALYKQVSLCF